MQVSDMLYDMKSGWRLKLLLMKMFWRAKFAKHFDDVYIEKSDVLGGHLGMLTRDTFCKLESWVKSYFF